MTMVSRSRPAIAATAAPSNPMGAGQGRQIADDPGVDAMRLSTAMQTQTVSL
jgi:hypothetical protein